MSSEPRRTRHPFPITRGTRIAAAALVLALFGAVTATAVSPQLRRTVAGPTDAEIAAQRNGARADDLKTKLDATTASYNARIAFLAKQSADATARANDLAAQNTDLTAKLSAPQPLPTAQINAAKARADDLKRQLDQAKVTGAANQATLSAQLGAAKAAAGDLSGQVDTLTAKVKAPRVVPPRVVTASLTKDQIIGSRGLLGLYTTQSPFNNAEFNGDEAAINRDAQVSGYFQSFDDAFRPDAITNAWARNEIPLMTWESQAQVGVVSNTDAKYKLSNIYGGQFDDYLRSYARGIHDLGLPVIIRLDHEMNGSWYPWSEIRGWDGKPVNGNAVGDYVKMWQHVHDIFQAEGANDYTIWLWSPNRTNRIPSQPVPANYYPGDKYTDLVGMSAYYRAYDAAPTFDDTFGPTLGLLREAAPGKPIFLSEIGATETNGNKAKWISSLFQGLAANPDIHGFSWFSLAVTSGAEDDRMTNDWRVNSSGDASRALAAGLEAGGFGRPYSKP